MTLGFVVSAASLALFGLLARDVLRVGGLEPFDRELTLAIYELHDPVRDELARAVTQLGNWLFLLPAALGTAAILTRSGRKVSALLFAGCVLGGWLLEMILKISFQRARPDLWPALVLEKTYSFPSGHATMATLFYGALVALVYHVTPRRLPRLASLGAATLLILAVGASRVYLGAHWATDVLGGILVGLFWVVVCAAGTEFLARRADASKKPSATLSP